MAERVKLAVDGAIAATAIASPLWLQYVQSVGTATIVLIGVIGAVVRLVIIWREYKRG